VTPEELELIQTNARIAALEFLLAGILSALAPTEAGKKSLVASLDQLVENAGKTHFPQLPSEYSDLVSAEIQQATENLVAFLKDHLEKH
jgi:hypothetical protein